MPQMKALPLHLGAWPLFVARLAERRSVGASCTRPCCVPSHIYVLVVDVFSGK